MTIIKSEYAQGVLFPMETGDGVCSCCGEKLRPDYYLLLSGWRSGTKELVSPVMRFCERCWNIVERVSMEQRRPELARTP